MVIVNNRVENSASRSLNWLALLYIAHRYICIYMWAFFVERIMMDKIWQPYIEKMRRLEIAVKLTAYHALETARATREATFYAGMTAEHIKKYLIRKQAMRI